MNRTLSAPWSTFFHRYVFPVFYCGLGLFFAFVAWFHPDAMEGGGSVPERLGTLLMLAMGIAICWNAMQLCDVQLDADGLAISNLLQEAHVEFAAITDISYRRSARSAPVVTVRFNRDTPLGRSVEFIPGTAYDARVDAELRRRSGLAGLRDGARLHENDAGG